MEEQSRGWLPNVVGVTAMLLAVDTVRQLVAVPPEYTRTIVLGYEVSGWTAYVVSIIFMLLYAWVSAAAFRRRTHTVWAVVCYCVYLIISVWIWSSASVPYSLQTRLITSGLVTALLLSVCRVVFDRRDQFDQG